MTSSDTKAAPLANHLTHFDASGQAHMVDVGAKAETHRVAIAVGTICMQPATFDLIVGGTAKKGGCPRRGADCRNHGRETYQ